MSGPWKSSCSCNRYRVVDIVGEGFDLGIRIGELSDSSLIARPLSLCKSILCASPLNLKKYGVPQTLTVLAHHNCLIYVYYRSGVAWNFNGPHGQERFLPRGKFQVNNSEVLYKALLAGMGIFQMPEFIVGPALTDGRLISLLPDDHLPLHNIFAIYPQRRFMPEKLRFLLEFFQLNFNESSSYRMRYEC